MGHIKKKLEIEFNWVMKRQIKGDIIIFDDYDLIILKEYMILLKT